MSQAYINAVRAHFPQATLVFNHFHGVKLMNDKVAHLRRDLQREADAEDKAVLKSRRWLLFKAPEMLNEAQNEAKHFDAALKLNAPWQLPTISRRMSASSGANRPRRAPPSCWRAGTNEPEPRASDSWC